MEAAFVRQDTTLSRGSNCAPKAIPMGSTAPLKFAVKTVTTEAALSISKG